MDIVKILKSYGITKKTKPSDITIGVLGGHSALDVCAGAKQYGFKTLVVAQKGREKTYTEYYRTRGGKGCVDEVMVLGKFADVLDEKVQKALRDRRTIFIHNRYFWVYFPGAFDQVEKDFRIPIFGSRGMVRMEERDAKPNQYDVLRKAGIRMPKILRKGGEKISDKELKKVLDGHHGPMLVKSAEDGRGYERDFFVVMGFSDYEKERVKRNKSLVDRCVIEEFVIGPQINFNYFYSPLTGAVELMGTDMRRQTNLDGFLRLTSRDQLTLLDKGFQPSMIENGHIAVTVKESILEKAFELGERFVKAARTVWDSGIIGPFALQGAYVADKGKEDFVCFDVSMRIPGSPGTRFTPYSGYLYGDSMSYGERIAMEIKAGLAEGRVEELLT